MIDQILFISDLHLGQGSPKSNKRFCHFLTHRAKGVKALYILGDLFDAWIGDDDNTRFAKRIKAALLDLSQSGTQVYFQLGNRDFLLGKRFCDETGIQLLDDYAVLDLYGEPTLLTHGDLLCTDDLPYQAFRKKSRSQEWQQNVLSKPLLVRLLAARWYRIRSYFHKRKKSAEIMDVNRQFVLDSFTKFQVKRMIHGHTHRPACHQYTLDLSSWLDNKELSHKTIEVPQRDDTKQTNVIAERFVLPAWSEQKGHVLCWSATKHWSEELT